MEILLLMVSIVLFVLIPPGMLYAMVKNPEEFGPVGTRTNLMDDYQRDSFDELTS